MSQLPISAANSTSFHNVSITSEIPLALGDISFTDREKYVCVSFLLLQGENTIVIQHPT